MARVRNDFGKRIYPHTAAGLLTAYDRAREHVEHELAVRYSMCCVERSQWHSDTLRIHDSHELIKGAWYYNKQKIVANSRRFKSLLDSVAPGIYEDLFVKDHSCRTVRRRVYDRMRLHNKKLIQVEKNLTTIFGEPPPPDRWANNVVALPGYAYTYKEGWKSWSKVRRGRDLRVKGWGKFVARSAERMTYSAYFNNKSWLTLNGYRSIGYDVNEYDLRRVLRFPDLVAWIGQYRNWWFGEDAQRRHRLDEVVRYVDGMSSGDVEAGEWRDILGYHPERALRHITEQLTEQIEQDQRRRLRGNPLPALPPLDDTVFEVPTCFNATTFDDGTLIPITTYKELKMVGEALRNCAATYANDLFYKECVMVYKKLHTGKIVALAEFRRADKDGWVVNQHRGSCNQAPSQHDVVQMKMYLNSIKAERG